MGTRGENLIVKPKEALRFFDYSNIKFSSDREFAKYFGKVAEYSLPSDKLNGESETDDIVSRSNFSLFYRTKADDRNQFQYHDACPITMQSLHLDDIYTVDIPWRMLTSLRPSGSCEEGLFNRLIDLGKLRHGTKYLESQQLATVGKDEFIGIVVTKTRKGRIHKSIKTCKSCGMEMCTGAYCIEFPYESYTRELVDKLELNKVDNRGKKGSPDPIHPSESHNEKRRIPARVYKTFQQKFTPERGK